MVRLELFKAFQVDHIVPKYAYHLPEIFEEKDWFMLFDEDYVDQTTIGLRLQQFVAREHLKEMVELEKLSPDWAEEETRHFMQDLKSEFNMRKQLEVKAWTTQHFGTGKQGKRSSKQTRNEEVK